LSQVTNYGLGAPQLVAEENLNRSWYAVYTAPFHEKQVAEHLKIREIENFLPLYHLNRRWKDGRAVTLNMPLFPSYVFVRASGNDRASILGTPGILSIVGTRTGAAALPAAEIEALRNGLHLHNVTPHPFLRIGGRAVVRSGALAGVEGIVLRHKNSTRLVLSLELIRRSVAVEIDAADLKPVRPRTTPYNLAIT
jgi:transcription antitermination factor NusG